MATSVDIPTKGRKRSDSRRLMKRGSRPYFGLSYSIIPAPTMNWGLKTKVVAVSAEKNDAVKDRNPVR